MNSIIALGLLACVALAVAHDAHSYASIHRNIHSNGGWDGAGGHGGYGGHGGHGGHGQDYYAVPDYKYEYGVKDGHTGDNKNAWEHRHAGHVENAYKVDTHHPAVYGHGGHGGGSGGHGGFSGFGGGYGGHGAYGGYGGFGHGY